MWAENEANMDERWQIDGPNYCRMVSKAVMRAWELYRRTGGLTDWRAELLYIFIYKVKYLRKIFNFF